MADRVLCLAPISSGVCKYYRGAQFEVVAVAAPAWMVRSDSSCLPASSLPWRRQSRYFCITLLLRNKYLLIYLSVLFECPANSPFFRQQTQLFHSTQSHHSGTASISLRSISIYPIIICDSALRQRSRTGGNVVLSPKGIQRRT